MLNLSNCIVRLLKSIMIMFNYCLVGNSVPYFPIEASTTTQNNAQNPPPQSARVEDHRNLQEKYKRLKHQYDLVKQDNSRLKEYVSQLEKICEPELEKKRVKRRMESELDKQHSCPYPACKKEYASVVALNLHIRNKHGGGTKKQRVAYIKAKINAERKGEELPSTSLHLPQEVIDYEMQFFKKGALQQQSSPENSQEKLQSFGVRSVSIEDFSQQ